MNRLKLKKLQKLLNKKEFDVVPKGYFCRAELEVKWGVDRNAVCLNIKKLMKEYPNKVTMKRFKVENASGSGSSVPYYKFDL